MKLIDARKVDGVASGTWRLLMRFLGLGAEIEGLLARNTRRGGDERIYIQFIVTNEIIVEVRNQEALNLWDRL